MEEFWIQIPEVDLKIIYQTKAGWLTKILEVPHPVKSKELRK